MNSVLVRTWRVLAKTVTNIIEIINSSISIIVTNLIAIYLLSPLGNLHQEVKIVYERFRMQLVTSLSMDDVIFLGLLRERNLFPGDLYEELQTEKTTARKAALFLDKAIQPFLDIGDFEPLNKLLTVMSDETYLKNDALKQLATNMKLELDKVVPFIPIKGNG